MFPQKPPTPPQSLRFEYIVASKKARFFSFILDFSLALLLASAFISCWVTPQFHSEAFMAFKQLFMHLVETMPKSDGGHYSRELLAQQITPEMRLMLQEWMQCLFFIPWGYFFLSEALSQGSSLGKRVFCLRVVREGGLAPASIFQMLLRSGLKTATLFVFFPYLYFSFLLIFFGKKHKMGHDWLTDTCVIANHP